MLHVTAEIFTMLRNAVSKAMHRRAQRYPAHFHPILYRCGCYGTHSETNPNSETKTLFTRNLNQFRLPLYRIRKAPPRNGWRRRPARERGLNENIFMVLVIA